MIFFAAFTLGYFAGVFTALLVFPPNTTELAEQEKDARAPIIKSHEREKEKAMSSIYGEKSLASN